jgi:hypothetical protein
MCVVGVGLSLQLSQPCMSHGVVDPGPRVQCMHNMVIKCRKSHRDQAHQPGKEIVSLLVHLCGFEHKSQAHKARQVWCSKWER